MDAIIVLGTLLLFPLAIGLGQWWQRDEESPRAGSAGGGALELIDELFRPAKQYEIEQRQTVSLRRDDPESGAPPLLAVDLDGGRVQLIPSHPER